MANGIQDGGIYRPVGEQNEAHGKGTDELQMQSWEIAPGQPKSTAALSRLTWSVTHCGSVVKSTGWLGAQRGRSAVVKGEKERESTTMRGRRRRAIDFGDG